MADTVKVTKVVDAVFRRGHNNKGVWTLAKYEGIIDGIEQEFFSFDTLEAGHIYEGKTKKPDKGMAYNFAMSKDITPPDKGPDPIPPENKKTETPSERKPDTSKESVPGQVPIDGIELSKKIAALDFATNLVGDILKSSTIPEGVTQTKKIIFARGKNHFFLNDVLDYYIKYAEAYLDNKLDEFLGIPSVPEDPQNPLF